MSEASSRGSDDSLHPCSYSATTRQALVAVFVGVHARPPGLILPRFAIPILGMALKRRRWEYDGFIVGVLLPWVVRLRAEHEMSYS